MNRLHERFRRKIREAAGTDDADCGCLTTASEHDCCGNERKRVEFPPAGDSQGTLRSTQVPWLAIR